MVRSQPHYHFLTCGIEVNREYEKSKPKQDGSPSTEKVDEMVKYLDRLASVGSIRKDHARSSGDPLDQVFIQDRRRVKAERFFRFAEPPRPLNRLSGVIDIDTLGIRVQTHGEKPIVERISRTINARIGKEGKAFGVTHLHALSAQP